MQDDFGLYDDSFIITIIGNRLESEITDSFIELLKQISDISKNIKIAIIGKCENVGEKLKALLGDSVMVLGALSDSSLFMGVTDILIQPERAGGGRSTVEALAYKVPVVVTKFGDSYYNAGESFIVNSYEEMFVEVNRLFSDRKYYEEKSILAGKRYEELNDIQSTLKGWMKNITKM